MSTVYEVDKMRIETLFWLQCMAAEAELGENMNMVDGGGRQLSMFDERGQAITWTAVDEL